MAKPVLLYTAKDMVEAQQRYYALGKKQGAAEVRDQLWKVLGIEESDAFIPSVIRKADADE